jgi:hypothetical protein
MAGTVLASPGGAGADRRGESALVGSGIEVLESTENNEADPRLTVLAFDMGVTVGWSWFSLDQATLLSGGDDRLSMGRQLRSGEMGCGEITGEAVNEDYALRGSAPSSSWVAWDHVAASRAIEKVREVWVEAEVDPELDVFVVVLEDFILRTSDSGRHTISPVRLNAIFEWELRNSGIQIIKQSAGDVKRTITDQRLQGWGLYDWCTRGFGGREHARDATRHATMAVRKWAGDKRFRRGLVTGLVN